MARDERKVLVLGSGGHARTLLAVLRLMQIEILGLTDKDPSRWGRDVDGIAVLGGDEAVARWKPGEVWLVNGIGTVGLGGETRRQIFETFSRAGYKFLTTIHPGAQVADVSGIAEGAQVQMGTLLQTGVRVGANSIVNSGAVVDHESVIGAHCHVSTGAVLCGSVTVEDGAFVGAGSVVRQGVRIGAGCVLGAGSLVVEDLPAGHLCYGHPARAVKRL